MVSQGGVPSKDIKWRNNGFRFQLKVCKLLWLTYIEAGHNASGCCYPIPFRIASTVSTVMGWGAKHNTHGSTERQCIEGVQVCYTLIEPKVIVIPRREWDYPVSNVVLLHNRDYFIEWPILDMLTDTREILHASGIMEWSQVLASVVGFFWSSLWVDVCVVCDPSSVPIVCILIKSFIPALKFCKCERKHCILVSLCLTVWHSNCYVTSYVNVLFASYCIVLHAGP
jgi:hypothetical protein